MVEKKPNAHDQQDFLPIPTYEEVINSRPSSSHSFLGPSEISHDAERQGLLNRREPYEQGYETPTVHSAAASLNLLPMPGENSHRSSIASLQREMVHMDILDPGSEQDSRRWQGSRLSKHINNLTHSLSSINLPFRQWLPSSDYIRARIPSCPEQLKPNWIIVGRIFALLLVLSLAYLIFLSDIFVIGRSQGIGLQYDQESIKSFVQGHVNESYIRQNSKYITSFDHIAGTEGNFVLGKWVEGLFRGAKLERVGLERFDVYLNYPKKGGRRVAIVEPEQMAWEAVIEEEPTNMDPSRKQTLVFHGHSKSGNVTGPLIYANYGSREDFEKLKDQGINLKGAIAIIRCTGIQGDRALKVKAAELAGAIGCITYTDFAEGKSKTDKAKADGREMPVDAVQRGAVSMMNWIVGDVLSSGFASLPGESRRDSKESNPALNKIPSIPLAWRDVQTLLTALKGHGIVVSDDWKGGGQDIEWWSGNQSSPIIHLMNEQDEIERQPIYNVIGKITGLEQPEKSVIVGNHRDAWCFGATDPGSGTAILLEVVRIFGMLRSLGWRPLRTIEFASWDGEEYNLIGSTEHVEARIEDLRQNGIAYLNVDVAVAGTDFNAAASPVFEKALLQVLDRTIDPMNNKTLRSLWVEGHKSLQGLGARSDYVAFQDMAGTSSIDIGFDGFRYPYHSCHDNFEWMRKHGDPDFQYHKTLAHIWVLLILEMADSRLLPFDLKAYSHAVQRYVTELEGYASKNGTLRENFNLKSLHQAANKFVEDAHEFHEWDRAWNEIVSNQGGFESNVMAIQRISHNTRMANFESNLLDIEGGLPGRMQFKHVIFGPQKWSGHNKAYFPGIRDAIDDEDWELAQIEADKVARILSQASRKLIY